MLCSWTQRSSTQNPAPVLQFVTATVAIALSLLSIPASGQNRPAQSAPVYKAPRTPDGHPDLNGIWQVLNTANWDLQGHAAAPGPMVQLGAAGAIPPGLGVVEGDELP